MTDPRAKKGGGRRYHRERFRALALYMLIEGIEPRMLFEAMFAADMEAYRRLGKSITGTVWVKTAQGVEPRKPKRRASSQTPTALAGKDTG